ncbi:Non-classical phosphatidylinositol transfer protein (PITP) [Ceratobasidium sp. 428]|nr:Non-classical phosphatidylinositol transfer protein (PITP) [Ceratobasidium sp. 428]
MASTADAAISTPSAAPTVMPQATSPLTSKFTEAERKAVDELRTRLPLLLGEAYPDKADAASAPFEIWGLTLHPERVDDARLDVVLVKFLRARALDVDEAGKMLISTLKWRAEFRAADTVNEQFDQKIFGKLGYVHGKDKERRPITYNVYGGDQDLKEVFGDLDRFLRWRVGLMERGLREIDFVNVDAMVQVHDYAEVSMTSRDANSKKAAAEATKLFQDYYPELLSAKFFVNVPALFTWIFWLFKPLVSAQTLAKTKVVGTGPETIGKEMLPHVTESELPSQYGGKATLGA